MKSERARLAHLIRFCGPAFAFVEPGGDSSELTQRLACPSDSVFLSPLTHSVSQILASFNAL